MSDDNQERQVIGAVRHEGAWKYYRCDEDFWVMDGIAWGDVSDTYEDPIVPESTAWRCGIAVLDEATAGAFLNCVSGRLVDEPAMTQALSEQFHLGWDAVADLFPGVMIDFDHRRLMSVLTVYDAGIVYENYAPPGWSGAFGDFYGEIPRERRYWIDGERDYLALMIELARRTQRR